MPPRTRGGIPRKNMYPVGRKQNFESIFADDDVVDDGVEEEFRAEHLHLKRHIPPPGHEDHEVYHSVLLLLIFVFMIGMQIGLFYWRKKYPMAFIKVTLGFLWLIPITFALYASWWKFVVVWFLYSGGAGVIIRKVFERPMELTTPKIVYRSFLLAYKVCMGITIFGYVAMVLDFLRISEVIGLSPGTAGRWGGLLIFAGLYFGVLGRDIAEVCTDRMASTMGLFSPENLPSKHVSRGLCSLCSNPLDEVGATPPIKLTCGHQFHEPCIRGWTIVGKKDSCPCCSEKVDLKSIFPGGNPWAKRSVLWAHLLDAIRYLIVWNPLIMITLQVFLYIVD